MPSLVQTLAWQWTGDKPVSALQWCHNGHNSVSNHQPHDCLLKRRSKTISKLRVTGLCAGNSPVTGEFPVQTVSNAENVSIWWCHHGINDGLAYWCMYVSFSLDALTIFSKKNVIWENIRNLILSIFFSLKIFIYFQFSNIAYKSVVHFYVWYFCFTCPAGTCRSGW